ncbi:hypothetical protein Clacol_007628 [Clathrus columnatus]|uniref:Major facilitator superfamily (MFS) profile domain-containing protein n=1 Tax=Clathrus columnatus TaxID=1419009 RepID=A0AAV5AKA6_9AGAM|nr:hypothetical protein Clacol_007628 [Clathrus columnatus]
METPELTPTATMCSMTAGNETAKDIEKLEAINADSAGASDVIQPLSGIKKAILLCLLCSAQFFDIFNAVSVIIALPEISDALHFPPGALQWVVSAYTLTFAATFLLAGRLTDIYHAKPIFCIGYLMVGILSILCAVSVNPIMLLIFRAIQGIGAALTFPSALAMIIQYFPEKHEQSRALAIFGGFGAIGNVIGFILGGVLTARTSWRWIFYLVAIIVTPFSVVSFFVLPKSASKQENRGRKLDWQGVVALSGALVLFVYGLTDGNNGGWKRPQIIVTLVFSVVFLAGFFIIEYTVSDPAIPPKTWRIHNFLPLFVYCWSAEIQLIQVFQDLWGWSAIKAAVHCIPIGISGGISTYIAGYLALYIPKKLLLLGGQVFMAIPAILFSLADTPDKYWSHILPGMIIATIGLATAYVAANVFILSNAPKGQEGVISAMMNTAFQLGATVGLAITTAITLGINDTLPNNPVSQFKGYQASFWSLLGCISQDIEGANPYRVKHWMQSITMHIYGSKLTLYYKCGFVDSVVFRRQQSMQQSEVSGRHWNT